MKWCIRMNTQEAVDYANKHGASKPYLFENHDRPLYAHFPSPDGICTTYSRIVEGYTELSLDQFKKYVLKQKLEVMKAQTFSIKGSAPLLEAIGKELKELGYNIDKFDNDYSMISHNMVKQDAEKLNNKKEFIQLYNDCEGNLPFNTNEIFYLPKQYNEALAFAKEQLLDKYWVEIPEYVKCTVQLGFCVVGKIYKTKPEKDSFRWLYEFSNTNAMDRVHVGNWDYAGDLEWTMKYFEPVTKEEYLKQQTISQLEVGKWYMITSSLFKPYEHISKFAYLRNGKFYYSERVYENTYRNQEDFHSYPYEVRLCSLEEIQDYLPDGHVDKIKSKQDLMIEEAKKRYPIGCKVKLLASNVGGNYKNEVRHTKYLYFEDQLYVDGNLLLFHKGQWAEIIPEIKLWDAGTYVVFLMDNIHNNGFMKGDIQQIKNHVKNERISYVNGCSNHLKEVAPNGIVNGIHVKWFATKQEAEAFAKTLLVKEEPKSQFKEGDYIVSKLAPKHIGRITEIEDNRKYYYWGFGNSGEYKDYDWYYYGKLGNDCRLATPKEIEKFLIKVAKLKGFKEGVYTKYYDNSAKKPIECKGNLSYGWYKEDNLYFTQSNGLIYKNGVWATIIPSEPKKQFEPNDWIHLTWEDGDVDLLQIKSITSSTIYTHHYYRNSKDLRINNACLSIDPSRQTMRLATKEEVDSVTTKKLLFGSVNFTIKKGDNFASTSYGKISKKEIADAIHYLENPPTVGGYPLTFFNSRKEQRSMPYMCERAIGFGCQQGKLSELKEILEAFD